MSTPVLQARSLTKHYGSLLAVDNLSLDVYAGEILGFLGPNGAGKTTSINMLCGLLKPDSGAVALHGRSLDNSSRLRVGVCPQNIIVWSTLTCLEQLEFIGVAYGLTRRDAHRRGDHLLEVMGLAEKGNALARTLSSGMQRRLNLIMALVHDPDIVILDEPEAGLDPQSRILVRDYMRSMARQKTIILTTQNMDEADRLADRVAIIDHGRLLRVDTPEALKRTVGEGDVLEIELSGVSAEVVAACLHDVVLDIRANGLTLTLRSRGIIEKLPAILEVIRNANGTPGEIRLRANTLEDVFISLTGRKLRE